MSGDFCTDEAVPSTTFPDRKLFCRGHQDRLDEIRQHIEDKAWANNVRNKEGSMTLFCETLGCDQRPIYGGEFCAECQGDG